MQTENSAAKLDKFVSERYTRRGECSLSPLFNFSTTAKAYRCYLWSRLKTIFARGILLSLRSKLHFTRGSLVSWYRLS